MSMCKEIFSGWTISEWKSGYRSGLLNIHDVFRSFTAMGADPAWITRLDEAKLESQIKALAARLEQRGGDIETFPLYGIPFAVKDNIDLAGWPTTAGCPAFAYEAQRDATVVQRLREAGAIVVGKTNLDQFATGLVGTRSPYGVVPNSFNPAYISGGSSAGSASVVARGIVPFALGTDTAGSGRVPAGFNNIVGLKPTPGWLPTSGVVPACRTLDCVSIFALTVGDAECVANIAAGYDEADVYSRAASTSAPAGISAKPSFGVVQDPEFFGDSLAAASYAESLSVLEEMGAQIVAVDFGPFSALAALLYEGPWVAERFSVVESLWKNDPEAIHPVVRSVVEGASKFTATDTFKSEYKRAELTRQIEIVMATVDALVVPTAPTIFSIEEVLADPLTLNARLGIYTNFANFADLCALALPAGIRKDGLPTGITMLASAWHDAALAHFGRRWQRHFAEHQIGTTLGATGRPSPLGADPLCAPGVNVVRLAVVGAHLRGMPLNHQLTSRGAKFVEATQTSPEYRLFALTSSTPPKPGLVRVTPEDGGAAIAIELWDIPVGNFGSFTAEIPPPLGIGSLTLIDNRIVKGFICEPYGLTGAQDITVFGGWRAYLASMPSKF
jgi:allophanate hydrolase